MRKSLTYKILAAVLAAGSLGLYAAAPAAADDYTVNKDGEIISSGTVTNVYGNGHSFTINGGTINGDVYGVSNDNYDEAVSGGNVTISGGTIGSDDWSAYVYGGYSESGSANDNIVNISGGTIGEANDIVNIYGGWSPSGSAKDNQIIIRGSANITNANLFGYDGYGTNATGNTLTIDGWSGSTNSVHNFNDIAFKNIDWKNNGSILTITNQNGYTSDLTNTTINTIHIAGGSNINVGESMTLIKSGNGTLDSIGKVTDTFTAGVARRAWQYQY